MSKLDLTMDAIKITRGRAPFAGQKGKHAGNRFPFRDAELIWQKTLLRALIKGIKWKQLSIL